MALINRSLSVLNPKFARSAKALNEHLAGAYKSGRTKTLFKVFETYRDPVRQADLFLKGVSKAGAFQSAHQFGLAIDFVPHLTPEEAIALGERIGERVFPGWNWHSSHDYGFLASAAKQFQLARPLEWDLVHVEDPSFPEFRKFWRHKFE